MKKFVVIIYTVQGNDRLIKEEIKSLGDWFNCSQGSWLVLTRLNVEDIYNRIASNKTSDRFLIMEIELRNYWGTLPKEAWEWLEQRRYEQGQW